jgi:ubiquinone/menaquinone biosynthesis C-methylase UbiE
MADCLIAQENVSIIESSITKQVIAIIEEYCGGVLNTMDTNSGGYYDSAASRYLEISSARRGYLHGIDQFVIQRLSCLHPENLLDIGAGDGRRSKYLAEALGVKRVTAIESSLKMADEARKQIGDENVLAGDATTIVLPESHFDAVISLWNVFGHISSDKDRVEVLKKISKSLKPGGKCIIDVNNRYNARHYGRLAVLRNMFNDLVRRSDRGWFPLTMNGVSGKVYLHRPAEIKRYLSGVNLKIESAHYFDYSSGIVRKMPWEGQCVYVLTRIT